MIKIADKPEYSFDAMSDVWMLQAVKLDELTLRGVQGLHWELGTVAGVLDEFDDVRRMRHDDGK